jgi:hypothetical protein
MLNTVASHSCAFCSLLSKVQNVEVSDTTGDDQSFAVCNKNYYFNIVSIAFNSLSVKARLFKASILLSN